MLLPSVAISIAIRYLGDSLTLAPNDEIAAVAVFFPAVGMGLFLWWQSRG